MTDIKCNDCHDAHSLELKMEAVTANDLCLDCHRSDIYDTYDHHFHKKTGKEGNALIAGDSIYDVGSGSLCVNCHMTGRYFMGVDFRRDHSFRIPRPDLTLSTGSPNACNGCHSENTAEWSVSYIDKWYGLSRRPHFATVFASARRGEAEANEGLIKIALDELFPVIVRATAIYELQNYNDSISRQAVIRSMSDPESMIRHEAVQSYIPAGTEEMMQLLTPMLNDPVKAVRMQAAFRMSSIPVDQMDSSILREFYESLDEYREAMEYTGEFSASRHNLGVIYQNLGRYAEAESNFLAAIRIDDQFYPSMANLAVTYNNLGKNDEAETLLRNMISNFSEYHDAHYSLGLLLAEKGDYAGALKELETATELVHACEEMSKVKTGALLVIERNVSLTDYERTGIEVDAIVSSQLLINIFEHNTPLHDGAIIIRGNRIISATCYLPLSDNRKLSKQLGTRHRAAVGISEETDALTVIVSEETGHISVTDSGKIIQNITLEQLKEQLSIGQDKTVEEKKIHFFWEGRLKREKHKE
jgi:predicted CXXCH cytochrome family protein